MGVYGMEKIVMLHAKIVW